MHEFVNTRIEKFRLRYCNPGDEKLILGFIRELAEYEKLLNTVEATESDLTRYLFSEQRVAEVILAYYEDFPIGFALFFHNFSTFVGKRGLYLEDLYIKPEFRNKGFGRIILTYLALIAKERDCGRFEWSVLKWNTPALEFYRSIGADTMDEWVTERLDRNQINLLASQF